jgi:hypothetical protein
MTKSWSPSWGSNYPESGFVKSPKRDTRALSPAGVFGEKGAAPLSGAEEQTARAVSAYAQCARAISAYSQCACLLSLHMGSKN